ncbi:MAG: 1-acyl-sn-glycerol-3-phosphate acyltransferase [Desulfobacterales bacterium]
MATSDRTDSSVNKSFFRRWIDSLLKGTHHYFFCFVPERIGHLSSFFLKLFYSGIKTDKQQLIPIQELPHDAVIVYATQYKSYFEFFYFYTRFRQEKYPFPQLGLDYRFLTIQPLSRIFRAFIAHIDYLFRFRKRLNPYESGYIEEELLNGRTAFLSLSEQRGFYKRFVKSKTDPISYLIELQRSIERPVFIIPQLMFFTKKPPHAVPTLTDIVFGPEHKPGRIRKVVTLFRKPDKIFVQTSQPLNLQQYLKKPENKEMPVKQLSIMVRRLLLERTNRHRQSITGPVLKPNSELKESILTSKRLRSFMEQHAEKRDIPLYKVYKKADAYIDEIASDFNLGVVKFGEVIIRWFFNLMFEGISLDHEVLNRVRTKAQQGPLILIPCHKSHIDYLMLSYILWTNNMPCPQIAAGKNLSFWPLGVFFRGGGAFFIRRTFRGALLYSRVFKEYIYKLLEEGFNIEFFIEGGRSRTGKLLMPKLGLLSILIEAHKNGACEDLIFVPIYIGYDRILEESAYLQEIEGGKKEDENIWQLLKARRFLKKRYGKIYLKFQDPFTLKETLEEKGKSIQEMPPKEQNALVRELGYRVLNGIDRASVVTPHALVASALLNIPKQYFSYEEFIEIVDLYMVYLMSQQATLADTLLYESYYAIEQALESYVSRKFVEKTSQSTASQDIQGDDKAFSLSENRYRVIESKRPNLEYYKNNSISFFIPAAYTSLSILGEDAFQFSSTDLHSDYKFLQELFQNEFALDVDKTSEYHVRKTLKIFIDEAIIMPHPTLPDSYNLTSAGFRKIKLFASFLQTFLESYWIVLNFFMRHPPKELTPKDRLRKIQSRGTRMHKRQLIQRAEALSKINYLNAIDFFTSHGIKSGEDKKQIEYYSNIIQRYLNLLTSI